MRIARLLPDTRGWIYVSGLDTSRQNLPNGALRLLVHKE